MSLSVARQCYSLRCGYIVAEPLDRCPKCRGRMRTARTIRGLGWVQVATGRRNRWITMIMLGLIGLFLIAEVVIRIVLDG